MPDKRVTKGEQKLRATVEKFNKKNNRNIEIVSEYQNSNTPVEFHEKTIINGKIYEEYWTQTPSNFEHGQEGNPLFKQSGEWTQDRWEIEFEHACEVNFPGRDIKCLDEYKDSTTPLRFSEKTEKYGKTYDVTWTQIPQNFRKGLEGNPLLTTTGKWTQQRWEIEFEHACEVNFPGRDIKCRSEYKGSQTKLLFYERTEKYDETYDVMWEESPNEFMKGTDGNWLLNMGEYTQQRWEIEFEHAREMYFHERDIKCLSEYINNYTDLEFSEPMTFPNGETEEVHWTQSPISFLRGYSSNPYDKKKHGTSFLQEFLYDVLSQYFVPKGYAVENRDTSLFNNYDGHPMELDIVVYDENHNPKMALEPGAWYHHQNRVEHDIEKLSVCNDNDLYCLLIYFGSKDDYAQAIETESIKNYKSENPDIKDNIWIYPNQFGRPTSQKDREELTNLVDALGRVMGVKNLSAQPEINIDEAIERADAIMKQSNTTEDANHSDNGKNIGDEKSHSKSVPEKFEEMLKATNNENIDIFER